MFITTVLFAQTDKQIQSTLDSICKASGYPGVVFSYVDELSNKHEYASGMADTLRGLPMKPTYKMHGGSTGKTIVSSIIMQLVLEGKISIEDKISQHLGSNTWYSRLANHKDITIRHLLQHSSGIVRYEFKPSFLKQLHEDPLKIWKPEELLSFVFDDQPPFEAGKGFTYSDTNYILLGMIIEKVTGKEFYEEAKRRILIPHKLTSFTPTNSDKIDMMAQGYYEEGSEYALGFKAPFLKDKIAQNNMQFEWTGGGYAYKTSDYALLLKKIYEGEIFELDKVKDDFFKYIDAQEIRGEYGLGVIKYEVPEIGVLIGHSGFFPGYNTLGFYHPKSKTSFAMQTNSTSVQQLRKFFGDYLLLVKSVVNHK